MNLDKVQKIPDKKEIQELAVSQARQMLEKAKEDPLKLRIYIKRMIEFLSVYDKEIDEAVREEAEKFGEKSFKLEGAKIELAEVGVKYDYSKSPLWIEYDKRHKEIEEIKKDHEKFLKSLKEPMTMVDENTGETIKLYPPAKSSKSSVKVIL